MVFQMNLTKIYFLILICIFLFQGLRTSRRWTRSRTLWPRSWLRHRDRRRRGRPGYCTTTPIVCRYDPDPHFRRGPGSLWAYCGHLPIHEIRRISPMLHHQFQKRRLFPPSNLQKVDLFKVSRDLCLIIRLNIVLNFEKKIRAFLMISWVMWQKVRLGALLFNYNINMQKWWVTVLDVFRQFLTAVKLASFHLNI